MLKELRDQILIWFGIVGGAITLISHQTEFFKLAGFARRLVDNFSAITHQFWSIIASYVHVTIPPDLSPLLTFLTFYASLTIGTILSAGGTRRLRPQRINMYAGIIIVALSIAFALALYSFTTTNGLTIAGAALGLLVASSIPAVFRMNTPGDSIAILLIFVVFIIGERLVLSVMTTVFQVVPEIYRRPATVFTGVILLYLPLLLVTPQALIKKLTFMLIGVALIFGLSELSKLAPAAATLTVTGQH
jgi:hypothetical protein